MSSYQLLFSIGYILPYKLCHHTEKRKRVKPGVGVGLELGLGLGLSLGVGLGNGLRSLFEPNKCQKWISRVIIDKICDFQPLDFRGSQELNFQVFAPLLLGHAPRVYNKTTANACTKGIQ